MKAKIIPYKMGSSSASALATELGILRVSPLSPTYKHRKGTVLINWGNVRPLSFAHEPQDVLNSPSVVQNASNKLNAFNAFQDIELPHVEYTTSRDVVHEWLREGHTVFARTSLAGHSGEGIVVLTIGSVIPNAPLYTKYKKKLNEYRVHVVGVGVIAVQEKKRANDAEFEGDARLIRSHHNGWNFCREDLTINQHDNVRNRARLDALAVQAIVALDLDFGAVDIIYNAHDDAFYLLEVNTAPGLEGQTLVDYVTAFTAFIN